MGIYLNPDNAMFQRARNAQFYVDKTGLVSFMNERVGTAEGLVCVSRPRRFGKSVDADMLVAYYSKGADSRALFDGLKARGSAGFEDHLNKHDVIKVDVQRIYDLSGMGVGRIGEAITARVIPELRRAWPGAVPEDVQSLAEALEHVAVEKRSGFVFVVDEWDFAMREAVEDEAAQRRYLDFLRGLFKGASYVDAAYLTGILPIKKYGQHSALNLFREYSVADPKNLADLMGFNADEVESLCARFGMDYAEMARWYDGYVLGSERIHVYNPSSVAGAISSGCYSSYWTQTEAYEALQRYIDIDFDGVSVDLVAMLDGAQVLTNIGTFENSMTHFKSKDDVYTLLVHLGYLGYDSVERAVFIPNEEIKHEFASAIQTGGRPQLAQLVAGSRELSKRTLAEDCDYIADAIGRAHASAAGPQHYNDEQALRAAVKLAYIWAINDYLRVDELPGGRGYADLVFIPKANSPLPAMLIELKWNKPVEAALEQVRMRNYPAALRGLGGECLLIGITYDEQTSLHQCEIERIVL